MRKFFYGIANVFIHIYVFLKDKRLTLYLIILLLCTYQLYYRHTTRDRIELIYEAYGKDQYNIAGVPDGLVIFKSGVPETYNPDLPGEAEMKYEKYTVGIWNIHDDIVYEIVIPRYVYLRFMVGFQVRIQPEPEEKNKEIPQKKRNQNNLIFV